MITPALQRTETKRWREEYTISRPSKSYQWVFGRLGMTLSSILAQHPGGPSGLFYWDEGMAASKMHACKRYMPLQVPLNGTGIDRAGWLKEIRP
jgi:hypothetical protein